MTVGERIKRHRERRGWTLRELAKHAQIDVAWIQRLESGQRHNISLEAAKRIALALGISLDYLAGIVNRPHPASTRDDDDSEYEPADAALVEA